MIERTILCLSVALILTGRKTSHVFQRPLAEVRQAIQKMQPDMLAEISPECNRVGITTNDTEGVAYVLHMQDVVRSDPWFPYLTVEARSQGDSRTKVTITRGSPNGSSSSSSAPRRRDVERRCLEALVANLEHAN